jgi:NAD(P)-dependent dehydrogenase (short-subunit alcohol dehydrogenase family)
VALLDRDAATLDTAVTTLARRRGAGPALRRVRPAQVESAAQAVQARFGRVDALVNNAGVAIFKPVQQTSFAEWREVMGTNLDGAFLCSQAFGARCPRSRRAIVNIASISALRASTLRVAYGTSKAALVHLTKQLAVEFGNAGIRVNTVCPGRWRPRWPSWFIAWPSARLLRRDPAGPLRHGGGDRRGGGLSVQRRPPLSTASSWRWMVASMLPAWACPRCAAPRPRPPADVIRGDTHAQCFLHRRLGPHALRQTRSGRQRTADP